MCSTIAFTTKLSFLKRTVTLVHLSTTIFGARCKKKEKINKKGREVKEGSVLNSQFSIMNLQLGVPHSDPLPLEASLKLVVLRFLHH